MFSVFMHIPFPIISVSTNGATDFVILENLEMDKRFGGKMGSIIQLEIAVRWWFSRFVK